MSTQNGSSAPNWGFWLRWLAILAPIAIGAGVIGYLIGQSNRTDPGDQSPPTSFDGGDPIDSIDGGDGLDIFEIPLTPDIENAPPLLNFDLAWDSADAYRSFAAAWGDIENDGDLDLVVGNFGRSPLMLHRFDRGRFLSTQHLVDGVEQVTATATGQNPVDDTFDDRPQNSDRVRAVAWGDADNDGDLDLAVARTGSATRTAVWLNDGTGRFSDVLLLGELNSAENDTRALAWGDYDADGDLDLVTGNKGSNVIYVNQTAQQDASQPLSFTAQPLGDSAVAFAVEWAQLNDNDTLDLLVGTRNETNKRVIDLYLDVADQDPGAYVAKTVQPRSNGTLQDVAVSNINGNTRQEVTGLYRNGLETEVRVFELDGDEQPRAVQFDLVLPFSSTQTITPTTTNVFTVNRAYEIDWADINRDGRLDLVTDAATVWLNGADGFYPANNPLVLNTTELFRQFVWADIEGDSDLDLAIISRIAGPALVYLNGTEGNWRLDSTLFDRRAGHAMAWADYNDDGQFDVAVGTAAGPIIYTNAGDAFVSDDLWPPADATSPLSQTTALAWGDANGDTLIDLAVFGADGQAEVWLHPKSADDAARRLSLPGIPPDVTITDAHWVDAERAGDLELFVHGAHDGEQFAQLYRLSDGAFAPILPADAIRALGSAAIDDAAWGDADGDGDADLALAGEGAPLRWFENRSGTLQTTPTWQSAETDATSVAWGDLNGDGDLDLVSGAPDGVLKAYESDLAQYGAQLLPPSASWLSIDDIRACAIELGDLDGDGDLDLAAFGRAILAIYTNRTGRLEPTATTRVGYDPINRAQCRPAGSDMSLTDIDSDGDLDIGLALGDRSLLLNNDRQIVLSQADAGQPTNVVVALKGVQETDSGTRRANTERVLAPAQGVATTAVLDQRIIPISYRIDSPAGQRFDVQGFYSIDGGGNWFKATPADGNDVTNLSAGEHQFEWDVVASGFVGQSDNVVFRIESLPVKTTADGAATDTFETPFVAAQTFPFRVRGLQIAVTDESGAPREGALVYRIPAGQQTGGTLLVGANDVPYRTDSNGRVEGFSQLNAGDSLVALWPVPPETASVPFTDAESLYFMSAAPNVVGLALDPLVLTDTLRTVALPVLEDNPLLLFDLDVSLEWDGRNDEAFMRDLEDAFAEASSVLFDVTNGQVALGNIDIYHDRERWESADIVILADNSLRPSATVGGVVSEPITKTVGALDAITYRPGQVQMGPIWDAFGESTTDLGDQWGRTLAHELSHYLLFLFDDYLGIDDNQDLVTIDCPISFMTYAFDPSYNEFLSSENLAEDAGAANPQLDKCRNTLGRAQLALDSWGVIEVIYPFLRDRGGATFVGPRNMPLNVTQIIEHRDDTPASTLPPRTFVVRQAEASIEPLPRSHGFLIQTQGTDALTDDRIMNLGNPIGGGDRIRVRGAESGDRFCLFDYSGDTVFSGCQELSDASGNIEVKPVEDGLGWAPEVAVSFIRSDDPHLVLTVTHALTQTPALPLSVQLYPTYFVGEPDDYLAPVASLAPVDGQPGVYTATTPSISNLFHARVWERGREGERESITQFSFSNLLDNTGNPINLPPSGPINLPPSGPINLPPSGPINLPPSGPINLPPSGPINLPPSGPINLPPSGPINLPPSGITADGQVVIYDSSNLFGGRSVHGLQTLTRLPQSADAPIPDWLTPVGPLFRVSLGASSTSTSTLRLSYRYLQRDVPKGFEHSRILQTYYLPEEGDVWQPTRNTDLDPDSNTAIATIEESGIYALMATVALPELKPGWNLVTYPLLDDSSPDVGFQSFAFDSVYAAERGANGDWITPVGEPECNAFLTPVETLQFSEIYWIYVNETASPFLDVSPPE